MVSSPHLLTLSPNSYPLAQMYVKWTSSTSSASLISVSSHIFCPIHLFLFLSVVIHPSLSQSMAVVSGLYIILYLSYVIILEASVADLLSRSHLTHCSEAFSPWLIIGLAEADFLHKFMTVKGFRLFFSPQKTGTFHFIEAFCFTVTINANFPSSNNNNNKKKTLWVRFCCR